MSGECSRVSEGVPERRRKGRGRVRHKVGPRVRFLSVTVEDPDHNGDDRNWDKCRPFMRSGTGSSRSGSHGCPTGPCGYCSTHRTCRDGLRFSGNSTHGTGRRGSGRCCHSTPTSWEPVHRRGEGTPVEYGRTDRTQGKLLSVDVEGDPRHGGRVRTGTVEGTRRDRWRTRGASGGPRASVGGRGRSRESDRRERGTGGDPFGVWRHGSTETEMGSGPGSRLRMRSLETGKTLVRHQEVV